MIKKLLLATVFCSSFFGIKIHSDNAAEQLLKQIDIVLFVLKRNTIRMERYNLSEFGEEFNALPKAVADKHCVCSIGISAPHSRASLICWDHNDEDRVKIIAGRKRSPVTYYLLLDKLVPFTVNLDDVSKVCFDCDIEQTNAFKNGQLKEKGKWSSIATTKSLGGEASMSFVLDGRVDAICGFFVQSNILNDEQLLTGKIDLEEALSKGLLVTVGSDDQDDEKNETSSVVEKTDSQDSKRFLTQIKDVFMNKLWAVKSFLGVSWQKVLGCFV